MYEIFSIPCSQSSDCPEYSKGCVFDIEVDAGVCDIDVYCNKFNGCVALFESFDSNTSNDLIIESYQTVNDKKNDKIPACKSNSDCFSNICKQGVCLVDDDDPIYNCVIAELGVYQSHVNCGKAANQLCYDHEDCISNNCLDVCDGDYYHHANNAVLSSSELAKIIVFLLLIFSIFLS